MDNGCSQGQGKNSNESFVAAKNHEVFFAPKNADIPIRRGVDFTKFVSMLVHKGLWFAIQN
jgi:hypothetical protein